MEESVQNQIARLATLKLKPYKKFIKALLKIEEQGLVPEKDYRKLRGLFQGQIALYLKKECAEAIIAHLMAIGCCVGMGNENSRLREELRTPILAIINILMENMGFGEKLDETLIEEMEKAENEFFPQLFRQAVKEALDNVLVNYSDYCILNRGVYEQKEDGEYIVFPFLNNFPYGCKIMIGPFTKEMDATILFQLYIPRYVFKLDPSLFLMDYINGYMLILVPNRELPLSLSFALDDTCLIELEQEDCYNDYIPSFLFDDQDSIAPYRRNYVEIAFALGQRAKYIFLNAMVMPTPTLLHEYIEEIEQTDMSSIYPTYDWKLDKNGDIVPKDPNTDVSLICE